MASRWTDCVIQQAIVESAQCLGYSSIREVQAKAIRSVVASKDVFISLPTGTSDFGPPNFTNVSVEYLKVECQCSSIRR